jgi:hypothetical protein
MRREADFAVDCVAVCAVSSEFLSTTIYNNLFHPSFIPDFPVTG